ncbi:MAG: type IV secretion system DNA-binding domain-containing protein [Actinomycetota bacterium]|nr:type IV secretion system DNA-binding domain-containing protein [Actinomycetota bacterium]
MKHWRIRQPRPPRHVWWRLSWPNELDPKAVGAFLRALAASHQGGTIVIETVATETGIEHWLAVPGQAAAGVAQLARTLLPQVRIAEADRAPELTPRRVYRLHLSSHRRPLLSAEPEAIAHGLLAGLQTLQRGEQLVVQWLLGPRMRAVAIPTKFRDFSKETWWQAALAAPLGAPEQVDPEFRKAIHEKQGLSGWRGVARIGVRGTTPLREELLVRRVLGALRAAEGPSLRLQVRRTRLQPLASASAPWWWPSVINWAELVGLTGWPLGKVELPSIARVGHRLLPAGTALPSRGRVIADGTAPGSERPLALSVRDSLQHLHVLGPTGVGKSTLLANLIVQDIEAGRGVVVIEPKGDLIADVLMRIPEGRRDDVVVIEPLDDAPVGINPLRASGVSPDLVADQVLAVFHGLYSAHWGPRTQDILHASLLTLARTPGMTLCASPLLLSDPAFRRRIVGGLQHDRLGLGSFWAWYEALSEPEKQTVVAPVMNKLRAFLLRPALRGVVGQADPRFDLRSALQERKIVLVNAAKGALGPETAALLGSLVVAQLWQAILGRSTADPRYRVPVMVYIDEFQDYLHLPTDMADALAQARGLGVGLTLAHQHLGQLSPSMTEAVLANARSRVCFTLPAKDASVMAKESSSLATEDFQGLGRYETYVMLLGGGQRTGWASSRTRPLSEPNSRPTELRRASRERYGTPRTVIEAEIEAMARPLKQAPIGVAPRRPEDSEGAS